VPSLHRPERVSASVTQRLSGLAATFARADSLFKVQSGFVQCQLVRRRAGAGFCRIKVRGDTDFTQTRHLDARDTEGVTFLFGILGRAGVVVRLPRTKGFYRATTVESVAPTFPGGSALERLALR